MDFIYLQIHSSIGCKIISSRQEVSQNRIRAYKIHPKAEIGTFTIGKVTEKYDDPYKQAEYAYSQITEVVNE